MKADFIEITPQMASEILELNTTNRTISSNVVDKYARDMKCGNWQMNGEPIQIGANGTLKNGQHRLSAIVRAGVPVKMLVVTGVPDETTMYDTGRKRSSSDLARFDGMPSNRCSSNYMGTALMALKISTGIKAASYMDLKNFIDRYGKNLDIAYDISCKSRRSGLKSKNSVIITSFFFALECGYPVNEIEDFANVFRSGFYEDKSQTSAIVIRNQIIDKKLLFAGDIERRKTLYAFENALDDFHDGKERSRGYYNCKPVFSKFFVPEGIDE